MSISMKGRMETKFRVYGRPKGQPRPRAFVRTFGGKPQARVYDAGTAEGWKGQIAMAAQHHRPPAPLEVPVTVNSVFLFPRPKRLLRKRDPPGRIPHTSKPDRDNLDKAVLDCLVELGFFKDDAIICDGRIEKWYCAMDEAPGAIITIAWAF